MERPSMVPTPVTRAEAKHLQPARTFQGIPGIAVSPRGRLFALWYSGGKTEGPENFVVIAASDDRGEHWTDALYAIDPPHPEVRAYDAVPWLGPDGKIRVFFSQNRTVRDGEIFDGVAGVWMTELDNPDDPWENWRWSLPRRIADGVMMNRPTVLGDGTWALPVSVWNLTGLGNGAGSPPDAGAKMVVSKDGGKTFAVRGQATVPAQLASFDEHTIVERRDGSLWMLIRGCRSVLASVSGDGGRTWSPVGDAAIPGPSSRLTLLRLQSGALLLVYHDTATGTRERLTAFLSDDDGKTFPYRLLLDERAEVSYPDAQQAADGTIFIVHDRARYRGGEIVVSRIREEDIRAGKLIVPDSQLKLVAGRGNPV